MYSLVSLEALAVLVRSGIPVLLSVGNASLLRSRLAEITDGGKRRSHDDVLDGYVKRYRQLPEEEPR
jgi:hypothetical protein